MPARNQRSWAQDYLDRTPLEVFLELHDYADATPGVRIAAGSASTGPSFGVRLGGPTGLASPWNIGWHGDGGADMVLELEVRLDSLMRSGFSDAEVEFVRNEMDGAGFHISTDKDRYPLASITPPIRQAIKDTTDFMLYRATQERL